MFQFSLPKILFLNVNCIPNFSVACDHLPDLNLPIHLSSFFRITSTNVKKKRKKSLKIEQFMSFLLITKNDYQLEIRTKKIRDHFTPSWSLEEFLIKKDENVTCRGIFDEPKKRTNLPRV